MSVPTSLGRRSFRRGATTIVSTCTLLLCAFSAHAQDSARFAALEKEVQELTLRLEKLAALVTDASKPQPTAVSADGWKSIGNWRTLKTGSTTEEVRNILGEPKRVDGGDLTMWRYENGGSVTFYRCEAHHSEGTSTVIAAGRATYGRFDLPPG